MYDQLYQVQIPARIKALKFSFGVSASKSQVARAARLAPTVRAILPGVYHVGACQVNLWHESCTCKASRARALAGLPFAPCAHFLALYLAMEWSPISNGIEYLQSVGIEEPEPIATYCHVKLPTCYPPAPQGFRVLETAEGWAMLENVATGTHASARVSDLIRLITIYE
jgi:hypothetical protein